MDRGADRHNDLLPTKFLVLGAALCALRYESLFMIGIACCLLIKYRSFRSAVVLATVSCSPLVLFGIYSVVHGGYHIPNSIMIKTGASRHFSEDPVRYLRYIFIDRLTFASTDFTALATQRILFIVPIAYLLFKERMGTTRTFPILAFTVTGCAFLHLSLATTGWFFRYEAYLILCAALVVSILLFKYFRSWYASLTWLAVPTVGVLAFLLILPFALRSASAFGQVVRACVNIHEQQVQMASFVKEYYDQDPVALNDIGAVCYYTNARIIDLFGLAHDGIARAKENGLADAEFLHQEVTNAKVSIAIVYDKLYEPSLLSRWQKIGTWRIPNNVICYDDIVSFYAVEPMEAPRLYEAMTAFETKLPEGIEVVYTDTNGAAVR